jgi:hypothetical protein
VSETSEIDIDESGEGRRDNVASAGLDPSTWDQLEAWRQEEGIAYRSDAVRRLIRAGLDLEQKQNSLRLRLVSIAIFLGVAGLPVGLAANGSVNEAIAFLVVIAALDFVQSMRGGRTFIQV